MVFDGTVTLGVVIQIIVMVVTIIIAWMKLDAKLSAFSVDILHHARSIHQHTERLDAIDRTLLTIIGDLQRLIGRQEGQARHLDSGI